MADTPNVDEVVAWLDGFAHSITFTRPGRDQSLGRDIAMTIIRGPELNDQAGIMGRCAQGVTPDGAPWPSNSDNPQGKGYASRKLRKYGWDETNRRTSQMLSQVALYGRTAIEPEQVTLVYGEDRPPDISRSPTGYIDDGDKKVTDVEKATFAHQQGRDFYGIGQGDPENVTTVAQDNVNQMIIEANGG